MKLKTFLNALLGVIFFTTTWASSQTISTFPDEDGNIEINSSKKTIAAHLTDAKLNAKHPLNHTYFFQYDETTDTVQGLDATPSQILGAEELDDALKEHQASYIASLLLNGEQGVTHSISVLVFGKQTPTAAKLITKFLLAPQDTGESKENDLHTTAPSSTSSTLSQESEYDLLRKRFMKASKVTTQRLKKNSQVILRNISTSTGDVTNKVVKEVSNFAQTAGPKVVKEVVNFAQTAGPKVVKEGVNLAQTAGPKVGKELRNFFKSARRKLFRR